VADLAEHLWNDAEGEPITYQEAVLEQYKIYVEMADRISNRRALTNTFFLTLNSAVLAALGMSARDWPPDQPWWLVFPLLALLGECFAWFCLMRSYRLLNGAKYRVIGAFEQRLPASPYWRAEWLALGEGRRAGLYLPLSHIEQCIPALFAVVYTSGFAAAVLA
jgi:hypothetical protein